MSANPLLISFPGEDILFQLACEKKVPVHTRKTTCNRIDDLDSPFGLREMAEHNLMTTVAIAVLVEALVSVC